METTMLDQIQENQNTFIRHESCDNCGSSDGKALYSDGGTYCFVCEASTRGEGTSAENTRTVTTMNDNFYKGNPEGVRERGLSEETCRKFGYLTCHLADGKSYAANYRNSDGLIIAQKLRTANKEFKCVGDSKKLTFFGQHLWSTGRKLVITEGEIDAMSVSQIQNHKWPTVSLPAGAAGAKRAIKDNWIYLEGFDEIILMFDMDEPGQTAAREVAEMLPLGKAKIATLPCKDANDCLKEGKTADIITAIFQARDYRPDGIVSSQDLRSAITEPDKVSTVTYPYKGLNDITRGLRKGELVTVTAGSGIGKTTLCSEIALHLHKSGERLGMIMLEESNKQTLRNLIGIHSDNNITVNPEALTKEELEASFDELFVGDSQIYLYDHFGSTDVDIVCSRIMFMHKALGVEWVVLDHISILVSGLATGDERKLIDMAMTKLRTLVQETGIGLILVSHLRRPEGDKGHEDGAKVRLGQLRGSHAIAQLSDICISLGVDPDNPNSNSRQVHLLKNRFTGQTGFAGNITYNPETGRLIDQVTQF